MLFVGTSVFTKDVKAFLPDEEYRQLQLALMLRPDTGELIQHSGGLRKIRWNRPGSGKRGRLRVIYYWDRPDTIYMLLAYQKSTQDDLTNEQLTILRRLVKEWLR